MSGRIRLRRRLLVVSAPLVLGAVLVAVKLISTVLAGNSAVAHYRDGDVAGLRADVATMGLLNVVEPANAVFAAGTLAVLEGDLDRADARFSDAVARDPQSCPARVNLELVRERQGDLDAWEARPEQARQRYLDALQVMAEAPDGCFAANTDPDPDRRAVRADAQARLAAKIDGLRNPPPAPAPPPPPRAAAPPPPSAPDAPQPPSSPLRLNPGTGDPLDRLRQVLQDAAAAG